MKPLRSFSTTLMRYTAILFVTLSALVALSITSHATAPRIECQISMATWCLAGFDGTRSMRESETARVWLLHARGSVGQQPMQITESAACSSAAPDDLRLIESKILPSTTKQSSKQVVYSLTTDGCQLSFLLPAGPHYSDYRQYMLYGVLVGKERSTQLNKASKNL